MDCLVMLRLWTNALCVSARAPRDALQCGCVPGAHPHPASAVDGRVEPRIESKDAHDKTDATLISGRRLKANLGGCRQRAPYPLCPTRKNGQGKTGADGEL